MIWRVLFVIVPKLRNLYNSIYGPGAIAVYRKSIRGYRIGIKFSQRPFGARVQEIAAADAVRTGNPRPSGSHAGIGIDIIPSSIGIDPLAGSAASVWMFPIPGILSGNPAARRIGGSLGTAGRKRRFGGGNAGFPDLTDRGIYPFADCGSMVTACSPHSEIVTSRLLHHT